MRRFTCLGLSSLLILASCVANSSLGDLAVAENNVSNLSRISLGMNERQVMAIMHPPYKQESYSVGKDKYHVWLYITCTTALGQGRMSPMNLTPLTFKNSRLIATGYTYYNWLKNPKKPVSKTAPANPTELEDQKLEKTIEQTIQPKNAESNGMLKDENPENAIQQTVKPSTPKGEPEINPTQHNPDQAQEYDFGPISMSSPPKKTEPKEEKPASSNKPDWTEEDQQNIEEESDQNFNFW